MNNDAKTIRKLSIIIPAYNEAATIREVIERVAAVDIGDIEKEIIISNDGSSDGTAGIVDGLQHEYPHLIVYNAPINFGKGAAVRVGMSLASGDLYLVQDADLELDPNDYPALLAPFREGATDVVYGSRFLSRTARTSRTARMANRFLTWLTNVLFRGHLTDMETAYKAFRPACLDGIRLRCVKFDFEPEITAKLLKAKHKIVEVPISYTPRTAEQGKKISWGDGLDAIYTLVRCRFFD